MIQHTNGLPPPPPGSAYSIAFNIPGAGVHIIALSSPLPPITNPVILDGTSQLGYAGRPVIELDGAGAGANASGLTITTSGSSVLGLAIHSFGDSGIKLVRADGNLIAADYLGTDATGTHPLPNRIGVSVFNGAFGNTIGGTTPTLRNVISGNREDGIALFHQASNNVVEGNYIGTDPMGTTLIPNTNGVTVAQGAGNNTIGGAQAGAGNLIGGSRNDAVLIQDAATTGNIVAGNWIGIDASGVQPLGNVRGVEIQAAIGNTIGGIGSGATNVIAASTQEGILIFNSASNCVEGNLIGTDATGVGALPNAIDVSLQTASNNHIGGSLPGAGNVIAAGREGGILIGSGSDDNQVQGNWIGTDSSGTLPLPNAIGVDILFGQNNTIGGTAAGAGNVISGNSLYGVALLSEAAIGNIVQGNFIGTAASGASALPNDVGIMVAQGASGNTIGGTDSGTGNLISGNTTAGILITQGAMATTVQGNFIGTDASGAGALGNSGNGVSIIGSGTNLIGAEATGAANTIAFNGSDGVFVDTGVGNAVLGNSIFSNGNLGVELANVGNNNQSFPVIMSAVSDGVSTVISGFINTLSNATIDLEFFSNLVCDPSGFGEGETFLAAVSLTTDDNGFAAFTITLDTPVDVGQFVTATATDASNNTSEFSQCVEVMPSGSPGGGASLRQADALGLPRGALANQPDFSAMVPQSVPDVHPQYTSSVGQWLPPPDGAQRGAELDQALPWISQGPSIIGSTDFGIVP